MMAFPWHSPKHLFLLLLILLITDRLLSLYFFGFVYTDIDQAIFWCGALDYSQGLFYEPCFYGQAYNYMLESLLAVPLIWAKIPSHFSLPIATTLLAIFPFLVLGIMLFYRKQYGWALAIICAPIALPIEYNFLTTISRGFVQAHFFVPVLFLGLLDPNNKRNVAFLFLASGFAFVSNPNAIFIMVPIMIYVYTHHYGSLRFYLKSIFVLPAFLLDYMAKDFYARHPERIRHKMWGLEPQWKTFVESFSRTDHFEHTLPIFPNWGLLYLGLFLILLLICFRKHLKKEIWFFVSILALLILTFSIPKIQQVYNNAGIFYSKGRFFLFLPLTLLIGSYLVFRQQVLPKQLKFGLLILTMIIMIWKNWDLGKKAGQVASASSFPVEKVKTLQERSLKIKEIALENNAEIVIHQNHNGYDFVFDSYVFNPFNDPYIEEKIKSVNMYGDRRFWLYDSRQVNSNFLLNGVKMDSTQLLKNGCMALDSNFVLIEGHGKELYQRLNELGVKFTIRP